ncbi:hypothetical protein G5C60_12045 [Streptomyces sp. HC44]|uniref:Uncharacterized protein n=1 Tax=Streptomyces scabichelini TaxID=2711217 RepID=A0A6G4V330_9ACTN|nr:hypothetical protein [Streptomyces scabichelini]NGO08335.1 hypothetical protein [Streptomyces scabichelini]
MSRSRALITGDTSVSGAACAALLDTESVCRPVAPNLLLPLRHREQQPA